MGREGGPQWAGGENAPFLSAYQGPGIFMHPSSKGRCCHQSHCVTMPIWQVRKSNQGPERLSDLPKVTELGPGGAGIQSQPQVTPKSIFFLPTTLSRLVLHCVGLPTAPPALSPPAPKPPGGSLSQSQPWRGRARDHASHSEEQTRWQSPSGLSHGRCSRPSSPGSSSPRPQTWICRVCWGGSEAGSGGMQGEEQSPKSGPWASGTEGGAQCGAEGPLLHPRPQVGWTRRFPGPLPAPTFCGSLTPCLGAAGAKGLGSGKRQGKGPGTRQQL